ncbi:glutamine-hydrolyzing GMP synthase [Oxyplasma meridianum]|uniref:GMP synthase [glutamine-hydrolyzing] subunit B n=1 Tax=Oxyplasma meridianum TaxID=3073602 RepID=A0AAX4NGU3_9ARCH
MLDAAKFIGEAENEILTKLNGKGILACSGGQDSTLLAVLANRAAGDRILTVFVDTGFLRIGEKERVKEIFEKFKLNYLIIDESEKFISRLEGVTEPEEKRKIIGKTFIDVFEDEAKKYGAGSLLQGTIAPDWIESGGGVRDTIKSHHNVGGLPLNMKLKLIEPLRDLYKDEIREISRYLGIPEIVQPFPGPGLAVRILGEVTREKLETLKQATEIVEKSVEENARSWDTMPWQFFAILLPVKTTGIHGDKRTYGYTIAIRMIDSIDAMSGTFTKPPWEFLENLSTDITNRVKGVNRVVYDVTNKPPGTIEWE